jgi:hypothetical protein
MSFEKEPNRKAVFRSIRWPEQSFVTIPYKGSLPLYHIYPFDASGEGKRYLKNP